jgi:hypothetical protein
MSRLDLENAAEMAEGECGVIERHLVYRLDTAKFKRLANALGVREWELRGDLSAKQRQRRRSSDRSAASQELRRAIKPIPLSNLASNRA